MFANIKNEQKQEKSAVFRTKITKNEEFLSIFGKFWIFAGFCVFAGLINKKFSKIKLTKTNFDVRIVCFSVTEFSGDYVLVQGLCDFLLISLWSFPWWISWWMNEGHSAPRRGRTCVRIPNMPRWQSVKTSTTCYNKYSIIEYRYRSIDNVISITRYWYIAPLNVNLARQIGWQLTRLASNVSRET